MSRGQREEFYVSISTAVRTTGLSRRVVQECVERRLVSDPLSQADLSELRRIRRLQTLGVNMPGVEIILHMRQRIQALQAELERWERLWGAPEWLESDTRWQRMLPWEGENE